MGILSEYFKYDLRRVMYPLAFHGEHKTGPFFEGWYFKMITLDGSSRLSVIPGIYIGQNEADSHAFIQIINGVDGSSKYLTFLASDFRFVPRMMKISIADNTFSNEKMILNINQDGVKVTGEVHFKELSNWPVRLSSPGVMGWFAWTPGMECYHGIVSMDHQLDGSLSLNNQVMNFSKGRGYMEKDWGKAMPRAWIWMQCNHFEKKGTSVSISIAEIPWAKRSFNGFLAGFLHDGVLYRFATYTGAKVMDFSVSDRTIQFVLQDTQKKLFVSALRAARNILQAPTTVQMDRRIMETLSAQIDLKFLRKRKNKWVEKFSGSGRYAGLEVVGNLKAFS